MNAYFSFIDWINSQQEILLNRLEQRVAINTFSWNTRGLDQMLALLHPTFQVLGGENLLKKS